MEGNALRFSLSIGRPIVDFITVVMANGFDEKKLEKTAVARESVEMTETVGILVD